MTEMDKLTPYGKIVALEAYLQSNWPQGAGDTGEVLDEMCRYVRELRTEVRDTGTLRAYSYLTGTGDEDRALPVKVDGDDIVCPHCGQHNNVVEIDRAERDNETELIDGQLIVYQSDTTGDWEGVDWSCRACGRSVDMMHLGSPEYR